MTKQYAILGFINESGKNNGRLLGYVGHSDNGGDFYDAGITRPVFYDTNQFPVSFMTSIKIGRVAESAAGAGVITSGAAVFDKTYRGLTFSIPHSERNVKFVMVEYDFTIPLEPIAKVIKTVFVEYRSAEDWKTRNLAYYHATEE